MGFRKLKMFTSSPVCLLTLFMQVKHLCHLNTIFQNADIEVPVAVEFDITRDLGVLGVLFRLVKQRFHLNTLFQHADIEVLVAVECDTIASFNRLHSCALESRVKLLVTHLYHSFLHHRMSFRGHASLLMILEPS